jgi:drug/metabolite transporter (DMT)-like permease
MPLSKLSLDALTPGWLTVVRFGLAAVLLAVPARAHLRAAMTPQIITWGVLGVGVCVVVQNVGVERTSVSHASLMVGTMPVLIAGISAVWHRTRIAAQAWAGLIVSLLGVAVVAGGGGGHSSVDGDALVLISLVASAAMTVAQVDMLRGRDPMAVTAVQFMAAAAGALPIALLTEGAPHLAGSATLAASAGPLLGVLALTVVGTLLPWVFFAYGQARVPAAVAGSFLNIEPLVGAAAGAVFFGDQVGLTQLAAGMAILAGVALSTLATVGSRAESGAEPQVEVGAERSVEADSGRAGQVVPLRAPAEPREELSADYLIFDRWATAA